MTMISTGLRLMFTTRRRARQGVQTRDLSVVFPMSGHALRAGSLTLTKGGSRMSGWLQLTNANPIYILDLGLQGHSLHSPTQPSR